MFIKTSLKMYFALRGFARKSSPLNFSRCRVSGLRMEAATAHRKTGCGCRLACRLPLKAATG
ncbi:MAG: hypothetical protein LBB66_04910, partial [Desulfovibrio sp.]|nr:hypothetical protein [Desulfovibrio sp.]